MTSSDFYCDEVLSGKTPVVKVRETDNVLAFQHTRPAYPVHIVVIPKRHLDSLLAMTAQEDALLIELFQVIRQVAGEITLEQGACRVVTNVGDYQDSKHLHWHLISGKSFSP